MTSVLAPLVGSALIWLAAAPGEPSVAQGDIPDAAKTAVMRRLDKNVLPSFRGFVVKPSERMPGYVVCGEFRETPDAERFERFFVVVPGSFAVLDRDGDGLVEKYWKLNGCR